MIVTAHRRAMWRIALQLQRQYESGHTAPTIPRMDWDGCWRQVQYRQRQWEWARHHGLIHAESICRHQVALQVQQLLHGLKTWQDQFQTPSADLPLVRSLYDELGSLFDEFPHVEWDLQKKSLSVHTDRVELNDIDLGPFEIRLSIRDIGSSTRYRVIALEPNPCADDSNTPHPHVHHDGLCEGDGNLAIQRALTEGRLLDFFVLVRQVLRTYNASSAYRSLEDWFAMPCADCGDSVTNDERCECERCGSRLCGACVSSCSDCGQTTCAGCVSPCVSCSSSRCDNCLYSCEKCGKNFCEGCLEDGLCPACHDPSTENSDDEPVSFPPDPSRSAAFAPPEVAAPTEAAVQPHGLGETPVLA